MASVAEVIDAFLLNTTEEMHSENIFVKDGVLYSYGEHWPIALKVQDGDDEIIYLNSQRRSAQSNKHIKLIQTAISLDGRSHQHRPLEFFQDEIQKRKDQIQ